MANRFAMIECHKWNVTKVF
jgi:hypothetical protein